MAILAMDLSTSRQEMIVPGCTPYFCYDGSALTRGTGSAGLGIEELSHVDTMDFYIFVCYDTRHSLRAGVFAAGRHGRFAVRESGAAERESAGDD